MLHRACGTIVAIFASGGETTDWSFQLSVILQEIRIAWWQLALLVNDCFVWLAISGDSWIKKLRVRCGVKEKSTGANKNVSPAWWFSVVMKI